MTDCAYRLVTVIDLKSSFTTPDNHPTQYNVAAGLFEMQQHILFSILTNYTGNALDDYGSSSPQALSTKPMPRHFVISNTRHSTKCQKRCRMWKYLCRLWASKSCRTKMGGSMVASLYITWEPLTQNFNLATPRTKYRHRGRYINSKYCIYSQCLAVHI